MSTAFCLACRPVPEKMLLLLLRLLRLHRLHSLHHFFPAGQPVEEQHTEVLVEISNAASWPISGLCCSARTRKLQLHRSFVVCGQTEGIKGRSLWNAWILLPVCSLQQPEMPLSCLWMQSQAYKVCLADRVCPEPPDRTCLGIADIRVASC